MSQTSSPNTAFSISAWVLKSVINWSGECGTTDTRNILSIGILNVAHVVASIVPVQAVLWWEHDRGCPLGTHWEASGELAVMTYRCACLDGSI